MKRLFTVSKRAFSQINSQQSFWNPQHPLISGMNRYFDSLVVFDEDGRKKINQFSQISIKNDFGIGSRQTCISMIKWGKDNKGKIIFKNYRVPWLMHQLLITTPLIAISFIPLPALLMYGIGTAVSWYLPKVRYARFMKHVETTIEKEKIIKQMQDGTI